MKRIAYLAFLAICLQGCSGSDSAATGAGSCDDATLPDPSTSTSTAEDDVTPAATAMYPGPCTVWRDDNLDGTAEAITKYTYSDGLLSVIQYDVGGDGTNDETYLFSYEQGVLTTRTDVSLTGALLRTLRYHHDQDGQLSHWDLHGPDDVLSYRVWHMFLGGTGVVSARNGGSTLLRTDTDIAGNGTIDGHMTVHYDDAGRTQRWVAYNATALAWVQNVMSRDTRGNPLLIEVDVGHDGTIQSRSVHTYDCWMSNTAFQPGPAQQMALQAVLQTVHDTPALAPLAE